MEIIQGLRIVAANPNGIRAYFTKNPGEVARIASGYNADIVVWNEIKGNAGKHAEIAKTVDAAMPGYNWYWNHAQKAGRHGVVVAVKKHHQVHSVQLGFGDGSQEVEGRLVTLELDHCYLVGLYSVNAGSDRMEYKLRWFSTLFEFLERLKATGKTVVAMGDWNVAPADIDIHDPVKCKNCAGFSPMEKQAFNEFLSKGWIDVYRHQNPTSVEYTFFCGRTKSADPEKNGKGYHGWRIDHVILDSNSVNNGRVNIKNESVAKILGEFKGSDHCPIMFDMVIRPNINPVQYQPLKIVQPINLSDVKIELALGTREVTNQNPEVWAPNINSNNSPVKPLVEQKYHIPTRVRIKRKNNQIVQGCDCYCGRRFSMGGWNLQESIWANPNKPDDYKKAGLQQNPPIVLTDEQALAMCLAEYETYIRNEIRQDWAMFQSILMSMISQGRSITLGCFCEVKPGQSYMNPGCHVDIIIKIVVKFIQMLNNKK
jgi:exodeoxyribonuclease III